MNFELVSFNHDLPYHWAMAFRHRNGLFYAVVYNKTLHTVSVYILQFVDDSPVELTSNIIEDLIGAFKPEHKVISMSQSLMTPCYMKVSDWMKIVRDPDTFFMEQFL